MEILCEVIGVVLEATVEILLEAVSNDGADLCRDLNAIRKGAKRPAWQLEKHVC